MQADVFGCADAIRPRPRENRRPRFSGTSLRGSLFRRAGTARPTPSCSWEIARFSPDNSIGKFFSNHWKTPLSSPTGNAPGCPDHFASALMPERRRPARDFEWKTIKLFNLFRNLTTILQSPTLPAKKGFSRPVRPLGPACPVPGGVPSCCAPAPGGRHERGWGMQGMAPLPLAG